MAAFHKPWGTAIDQHETLAARVVAVLRSADYLLLFESIRADRHGMTVMVEPAGCVVRYHPNLALDPEETIAYKLDDMAAQLRRAGFVVERRRNLLVVAGAAPPDFGPEAA